MTVKNTDNSEQRLIFSGMCVGANNCFRQKKRMASVFLRNEQLFLFLFLFAFGALCLLRNVSKVYLAFLLPSQASRVDIRVTGRVCQNHNLCR
jgi:hypothetical protein